MHAQLPRWLRPRPAVLLLGTLALAGCADAPREVDPGRPATSPTSPAVASAHGGGAPASAAAPGDASEAQGGLKWKVPGGWKEGPERPMRAATYLVPAAGGDREGAECAVFYFGQGQGGGVEANLTRWIGQFEQPDGSPSASRAKQQKETVNGLPVTTIDLSGTFLGGPGMAPGEGKKESYRLLGAIVEGPQGAVFFKLTGPAKTVAAAQGDFQSLLKSVGR